MLQSWEYAYKYLQTVAEASQDHAIPDPNLSHYGCSHQASQAQEQIQYRQREEAQHFKAIFFKGF
jgi:hypothetical protein